MVPPFRKGNHDGPRTFLEGINWENIGIHEGQNFGWEGKENNNLVR